MQNNKSCLIQQTLKETKPSAISRQLTQPQPQKKTAEYGPPTNTTHSKRNHPKTDPQGNITTYTYEATKNLTSEKDAQGNTTSYTYDTEKNMTSVTDPLGNTTSYTYNTFGQTTSITDSQNKITTYTYDAKATSYQQQMPRAITQFTYDSKAMSISMTNQKTRQQQ